MIKKRQLSVKLEHKIENSISFFFSEHKQHQTSSKFYQLKAAGWK